MEEANVSPVQNGRIVRPERPADHAAVATINLAAFHPSEGEAVLVDRLREHGKVLLSLVAEEEKQVVGHILFSPAVLKMEAGGELAIAALGPVAVEPAWQNKGIGSELIRTGLAWLKKQGWAACMLLGHPTYYPRFGFRPAHELGIRLLWEVPLPAFMILGLQPGALEGAAGVAEFAPEFDEV